MDENENITIEVSRAELLLITEGVSETLQTLTKVLEKHRNHKDYSMDKLFAIMEIYATTGNLWAKLHRAQGLSQEEIALYLSEQEK